MNTTLRAALMVTLAVVFGIFWYLWFTLAGRRKRDLAAPSPETESLA